MVVLQGFKQFTKFNQILPIAHSHISQLEPSDLCKLKIEGKGLSKAEDNIFTCQLGYVLKESFISVHFIPIPSQ